MTKSRSLKLSKVNHLRKNKLRSPTPCSFRSSRARQRACNSSHTFTRTSRPLEKHRIIIRMHSSMIIRLIRLNKMQKGAVEMQLTLSLPRSKLKEVSSRKLVLVQSLQDINRSSRTWREPKTTLAQAITSKRVDSIRCRE